MVERYEFTCHDSDPDAVNVNHGRYVRYSDFAELVAENERLRQELASHPRDTNTVDAHEAANVRDKPEGQQEPVAWLCIRGDNIGLCFPSDEGAFPVYRTRPSEQAVTEAGNE